MKAMLERFYKEVGIVFYILDSDKTSIKITCNTDELNELFYSLCSSGYFRRVCLYVSEAYIHIDNEGIIEGSFVCLDGKNWEKIYKKEHYEYSSKFL